VQVCQDITELDISEINCDDVRWHRDSGRAQRTVLTTGISSEYALPGTSPCVRLIESLFRRSPYPNLT